MPPIALALRQPSQTPARALLRWFGIIVIGTALLAASAHVKIPFWPVPMTMQTFVVLMLGATLGARAAAAVTVAYLAEGVIGLPVFSSGTGLGYLAGPTGGYLIGFVVAATLVGIAVDRWKPGRFSTLLPIMAGADAVLLACGVAWLAHLIGPSRAIAAGLLPFLPAEAVKVALAAACAALPAVRRLR